VTKTLHLVCGIGAAVLLAVLLEFVPAGGLIAMGAAVALALTAALAGTRLPLMLRVFATAFILYYGSSMCLVGRTMEPGLTRYTLTRAVTFFGLFAALPTLSLLRLWQRRLAVMLTLAAMPLSLIAAALVAGMEEHWFVQKYQETGVGPTPRWTVSDHWLSYDRETRQLSGSD
jgi:hypothetical protein